MKLSRKVVIPTLALGALTMVGAYGINTANAHGFGFRDGLENRDSLIQRLVERFNLNRGEVEEVFEQHREERQNEQRAQREERLNQAVASGKITEDQKNALIAKINEWRAERENIRNLSEERHEKMREHHEEMRQWMEGNDVERGLFGGGQTAFIKGFALGFNR